MEVNLPAPSQAPYLVLDSRTHLLPHRGLALRGLDLP